MRILAEKVALERLRSVKDELRSNVAVYEKNAKACATCNTPGACCLDEHFVNVRISRLEAVAIANVIDELPAVRRAAIDARIAQTEGRSTYPCPLYEKSSGCLVHDEAKPVPCMIHACYERAEDLPPEDLQDAAEMTIDRLNQRVYGSAGPLTPIPAAVQAARLRTRRMKAVTKP